MSPVSKEMLMELQKNLKTDAAIGEKLGVTRQRVQKLRKAHGIRPIIIGRPNVKLTISRNELIQLQKNLVTDIAIGRKLGVSAFLVRTIRTKYEIPGKNDLQVKRNEAIIDFLQEGMSGTAIANKVGISLTQVYRIIRDARACWKTEP